MGEKTVFKDAKDFGKWFSCNFFLIRVNGNCVLINYCVQASTSLAIKFIILLDAQNLPSTSQTTNCLTSDLT